MKPLVFLLVLTSYLRGTTAQSAKFYEIRRWQYLNFTWPDEDSLRRATLRGQYVPENIVPTGVKYFEDYYYITLPRFKRGVPATLTRIKAGHTDNPIPLLEPFPSWDMNSLEDCNNLQSVQNVEIDAKGQMWIIDGGTVQTLALPVIRCSPKLVLYDIRGARATVYQFPEEVASRNDSFLYDLVVDATDGGYAYITDNSAVQPGIIVYSAKENRSWKIRSPRTMSADPSATRFTVNEVTIDTPINIAGIALGPNKIRLNHSNLEIYEDRVVYFCPLSSLNLYSIDSGILRNESFSKGTVDHLVTDVGLKSSQTGGMIMDNRGILYYSLLGNNAIGRWDSRTSFQSDQRLIARDPRYLQWANSFTFDRSGNLTVLMNRFEKFVFGKIDPKEYNYRLITSFVGGASYVYEERFNYDVEHNATVKPSPRSMAGFPFEDEDRDDHDHLDVDHSQPLPRKNGTDGQKGDQMNATVTTDTVVISQAPGSAFVASLLIMALGGLVVLA